MIDDATQKNLTEHLEAFFERRKGIVCEVESVIVPDPVAMLGVESPVMDQIKPSGAANVYFRVRTRRAVSATSSWRAQ